DRPALGIEEDLPEVALARADPAAVVVGGAPVPGAIPGMEVDRFHQAEAPRQELGGAILLAQAARDLRPVGIETGQELRQPDRLAALFEPERGEAVVPVAGADVGEAARRSASLDAREGALDVLAERRGL